MVTSPLSLWIRFLFKSVRLAAGNQPDWAKRSRIVFSLLAASGSVPPENRSGSSCSVVGEGSPILQPTRVSHASRFQAGARSRDTAADAPLGVAADGLAKHLSLLFVPAGVGVMLHAARLVDEGAALAVALVASTVLALAATGLTFQWLLRRAARDGQAGSDRA